MTHYVPKKIPQVEIVTRSFFFFFFLFFTALLTFSPTTRDLSETVKTTYRIYSFSPHTAAATDLLVAAAHYSVSLIVLSLAAIKHQFSAVLNSRNCKREQFRGFFLRESDDQLDRTSTRWNVLTSAIYFSTGTYVFLLPREKQTDILIYLKWISSCSSQ